MVGEKPDKEVGWLGYGLCDSAGRVLAVNGYFTYDVCPGCIKIFERECEAKTFAEIIKSDAKIINIVDSKQTTIC